MVEPTKVPPESGHGSTPVRPATFCKKVVKTAAARVTAVTCGLSGPLLDFAVNEPPMKPVALVVDDSMLVRHTVCRFLEERGYEVESASNGVEAVAIVGCLRPDLIVTDMQMPRMTGPEFITVLKSNPTTASVPIVVLSGRRSPQHPLHEDRADYTIWKDIDIVAQLDKALATIFTTAK